MTDKAVKAVLVNIFGDLVVNGIVEAYKYMGDAMNVPITVLLQGTNAIIVKEIIDNSGLAVHSDVEFQEAAVKVKEVLV